MRSFDYSKLAEKAWDNEILNLVAKIHECKGRQDLFVRQKPVELDRLVEIAKIQSTESSNKIEGIVTTSTRMKQLFEEKITPRNRDEDEIMGYRDVLNTIHESSEYIPIRPSYILQLHRDLLKRAGFSFGGHFKNVQNYINQTNPDGTAVTRFTPVAPYETPEAVDNLCKAYEQAASNERIDPLLLIVDTHGGVDEDNHQSYLKMGNEVITGDDVVKSDIHPRLVFLSACNTFTTYNTVSTIANAFFQVGAAAVTTSYMPVLIEPATTLYTRLLNNLNIAASQNVHRNWLAFMSHLMRTSYIQAPIYRAVNKDVKIDIDTLTRLTTESMFFRKRREIYKNLNTNAFTKGLGADYQNIIPHYLMYSTLGRADLIRFETSLKFPDEEEN